MERPSSIVLQVITILAPSDANSLQAAAPIPLPPPVIITVLSLIKCTRKGFVLSILSASKWLLAYVVTLVIFPRVKPYVNNIIDNEYVLDISLGVSIFVITIFIILMIILKYC